VYGNLFYEGFCLWNHTLFLNLKKTLF